MHRYSIVIPAYNEAGAIGGVLEALLAGWPQERFEIIVVDDCSTDETRMLAGCYPVVLLSNVQNFGYGYSLKRGIVAARHEHIIIMDADGSYAPEALTELVAEYEKGFDMVVGARQGAHFQGSPLKHMARTVFRLLSEFATGRRIPDINSGCRIFRKDLALGFFPTLSSGFSFTTTITLAFMLNAHSVAYVPIAYHKRLGFSHVRYVRDTLRSLQIIVEAITIYNPLKIFLLLGLCVCVAGIAALLLAVWHPWAALIALVAVIGAALVCALGLIGIILKSAAA